MADQRGDVAGSQSQGPVSIVKGDKIDQPAALVFLHVPKTAGSSLTRIVLAQYNKEQIFATEIGRLKASIEEFKTSPESLRVRYRLVYGHMTFGLHSWLPQPASYLAMLREPIDRVVSLYYYLRESPGHHLYDYVTGNQVTLEEYVSSGITSATDNQMVRLISGGADQPVALYDHGGVPFGEVSRTLLDQAKKNLVEHFSVVGLTEQFDRSVELMATVYGWNVSAYERVNVTKKRPAVRDLPRRTRKLIERHNELDLELYEFARQQFKRLCSQHLGKRRPWHFFRYANRPV